MKQSEEMRYFLSIGKQFLVDKGAFTRTTKILGKGGFAIVYEGVYDFKPIAVKYAPNVKPEDMLQLMSEINALIRAQSKHMVKILGVVVNEAHLGQFEVFAYFYFTNIFSIHLKQSMHVCEIRRVF